MIVSAVENPPPHTHNYSLRAYQSTGSIPTSIKPSPILFYPPQGSPLEPHGTLSSPLIPLALVPAAAQGLLVEQL